MDRKQRNALTAHRSVIAVTKLLGKLGIKCLNFSYKTMDGFGGAGRIIESYGVGSHVLVTDYCKRRFHEKEKSN